jgi:putative sigma-54 modulation protein
MKLTIQSLHFTTKEELNNFVTEKVNKLSHFFDHIESANVCLKLDKSNDTNNKVCEIRLAVPGEDLFAKKQCKTFEEATSEAVDALEHQINKMKAKLENQ